MEKKTLGSFLSALRRAQGLTQQEVADRLAVSNKAVSRWERDEAMPDILLLPAIADLFGVTVDELLRGERLRETPPREPAPVSSTSDTTQNPNEPPAEPSTDGGYTHETPPDPRALRGLRAMMNRAITQFRNFGILAFALAYAGLLVMVGISYGFYRPVLGYALQMLLELGGLSVLWFAAYRMRDHLNEQIYETIDSRLPVTELARGCFHYANWVWLGTAAAAHAFVLGSVLCLKSGSHSVLIQSHYAALVLIITILYAILTISIKPYAMRRLCRPWEHICGDTIRAWTPSPHNSRALVMLALWQILPALTGMTGCIVLANFFDHPEGELDPFSIFAIAFLLAGITVACVAFSLYLRREPKGSPARRDLMISGIRNLVLIVIAIFTVNGGVTFSRIENSDGTFEFGQHWQEEVIFFGIIAGLTIVLAAELVRRHLQKKKP